jgi:hypothetical protein
LMIHQMNQPGPDHGGIDLPDVTNVVLIQKEFAELVKVVLVSNYSMLGKPFFKPDVFNKPCYLHKKKETLPGKKSG